MKYIDDIEERGKLYDHKELRKMYKGLKVPKDLYNASTLPFDKAKWHILLSERATGKTTNCLLYGLCMYVMYGCQVGYIRQTEMQIAPKNISSLFSVIVEYGYIAKLTNNKYNNIIYRSRKWYLCNIDDTGAMLYVDTKPFMYTLAVELWNDYKSSLVVPEMDLLIFDEFIGKYYTPDEFIHLCDIISTIGRHRESLNIILTANTINRHSTYFNELCIYDKVQHLKIGDKDIITSLGGTNIYIELIESDAALRKKKNRINELYYGFPNTKLQSITGGGWSVASYPHTPRDESNESIIKNFYLSHNNKIVQLEIMKNDTLGIFVNCHWATQLYDDSIIFTIEDIKDSRYLYKFGADRNYCKKLWSLYNNYLFFYASNDVGEFIENYIKSAKKL